MSWALASFLLVGLALGAGWLTYERGRPSARMVAVIGTLAALAALGRDAFVALPDVKPITAMTLVIGYSLGPVPGFAVGALGMLASNVMLGQGPYTPWQMAAWGGVGLLGALLGMITGRRLSRLPIAVACALAALLAKEVMNLYTWSLGAIHTGPALLAVAGAALPFDLTDVVASFCFGLAFGPELARLLARVRSRMEVSWEAPRAAPESPAGRAGGSRGAAELIGRSLLVAGPVLGAGLVLALAHPAALANAPAGIASAGKTRSQTSREVAYLLGAQNRDGGFGGSRGEASSELYSAWAAIGLAAAGRDPLSVRRGGHTVLDSIRAEASSLQGAGDLERTILALRASGVPANSLPGGDPVARLLGFRSADGSFEHLSNLTAFGILALRAAGYPPRQALLAGAARWLAHQQNADGGFGFAARGGGSDVDDTAAALQALVATGERASPGVARASAFLRGAQNSDGGFPQQLGGRSNAQSTAWALQGLAAVGQNATAIARHGGRSAIAYLESLLAPDGSVRYSPTANQTPVWVTSEALTALAGRPFPISPPGAKRSAVQAGSALHASSALHTSSALHVGSAVHPRPAVRTEASDRVGRALDRALARIAGALRALLGNATALRERQGEPARGR